MFFFSIFKVKAGFFLHDTLSEIFHLLYNTLYVSFDPWQNLYSCKKIPSVLLTVIAPEKVSVHTLLCLNFQIFLAYRVHQGW